MALLSFLNNAAAAVTPARKAPQGCPQRLAITVPSVKEGAAADNSNPNVVTISAMDAFLFRYLGRDSMVIPIGVFLTTAILASGLSQFNSGNKANQQLFMRARVVTQGVTVAAMLASLGVQEREKALGIYEDLYN